MSSDSASGNFDPPTTGPVVHGEDGQVHPLPLAPSSSAGLSGKDKKNLSGNEADSHSSKKQSVSGNEKAVDQKLVAETQQQIKTLVGEIVKLSKEDISREEFFSGFLARCVTALSSNGGALWLKTDSVLSLDHQVNLSKTGLPTSGDQAAMHDRLLKRLLERGEPAIEPPKSAGTDQEFGNPTDSLLVIAPIKSDGQTIGLVEIFQRTGGGPVTQRGYLRFLMQMAELAGDFEKQNQIRQLDQRQELWSKLEQFLTCIHKTLDPVETAYRIASDGRRFVGSDRMTVASVVSGKTKVVASSGLDLVQRRADQIKAMESLISVVCRAKKPLYYTGDSSNLAPQIENSLHSYLDLSHSKSVAVIPVAYRPVDLDWDEMDHQNQAKTGKKKKPQKKKLLGALVVENLADDEFSETQLKRIALVKEHGTLALGNADQHNGIFMMPFWKAVGRWTKFFHLANLPKTLSIAAVIVFLILALVIVPYEFAMPADGVLQPVVQHEVYAQGNGIITNLPIPKQENVTVDRNQKLVDMVDEDLEGELEISFLEETKQKRKHFFTKKELVNLEDGPTKTTDQIKLQSQMDHIAWEQHQQVEKIYVLEKKRAKLNLISPIAGQVIDWNHRQRLKNRPVNMGERLMTIVDSKGDWEIEIYLPEKGSAHVLREYEKGEPLKVEFGLYSHPNQSFIGELSEIEPSAHLHPTYGNVIRCKIRFNKDDMDPVLLRPGTRVKAKILCGNRSVGYVMFRELIETVQSQVLFWF